MGHHAHAWRFEWRVGRRGRVWARAFRYSERRRGFDSHPGRLQRSRRHEAELWSYPASVPGRVADIGVRRGDYNGRGRGASLDSDLGQGIGLHRGVNRIMLKVVNETMNAYGAKNNVFKNVTPQMLKESRKATQAIWKHFG